MKTLSKVPNQFKSDGQRKIIGVKELRNNLDNYISLVRKGRVFTVVKRSKPVFKIAPVDDESQWETVVDFTKIKKGGVSAEEVLVALSRLKKNA
ncbi:MAG: type II toxin-antitoxin system prevent-host-death family antitoxin [Patescibacteria group bacterium]